MSYPFGPAQTQGIGLHKGINTKGHGLLVFTLGFVCHNDLDAFEDYFVDSSSIWGCLIFPMVIVELRIFSQNITDIELFSLHHIWWLIILVCPIIYVYFDHWHEMISARAFPE